MTPSSSATPSRAKHSSAFRGAIALVAVATVVGLVALWPSGEEEQVPGQGLAGPTERAEVQSVTSGPCPPPQEGICHSAQITLESGPDADGSVELALGESSFAPELEPGDAIRVSSAGGPATGEPPDPGAGEGAAATTYTFADFERRTPMIWLALAFCACVLLLGRLRGALSLVGLALSLAIVLVFIVPAIAEGEAPLAVAVVGALAVMLVTIPLAHGTGPKTTAAILGTTLSLALVAGLAAGFTELANLTGLSSEEVVVLQLNQVDISVQGLLLAGMVIGALGVLDDVTVSQASTVMAIRNANPTLRARALFSRALAVGRDHVSATVNTLVLAYVGASLPVLLLFSSSDLPTGEVANGELVAKEIVATLVGSIGLIAAVPITTLLATVLAVGSPPADDGSDSDAGAHEHHHH
jgi:uncharacterized membrane protein